MIWPRPAVRPPAPWQFPAARRWRTDSGLSVQAYHLPGQHVLAVRLGIEVPASVEPPGQEGVGLITARSLDEGTTGRTALQLAEQFESRGIAAGAGAGERGLYIDLDLTAEHLGDGLSLLAECICEPRFEPRDVARIVRSRLAEIAHEQAEPATRAALQFLATYHPGDDRAALPVGGQAETIEALTAAEVGSYHDLWCRPESSHLVIAGDLDGLDVVGLIDQSLQPWQPRPGRTIPQAATVRADDAERVVFIDRPEAVQTEVYLGRPGPDRRDARGWGVYQVLSLVVGGSPHSRLDRVLREELGYTYGMSAGFRPRRSGGVFAVSGALRAEATVPALEELLTQIGFAGTDLAQDEVRRAADFVAHTAPGRYATADVVAAEALALAMDGLPEDTVSDNLVQVLGVDSGLAAAAWDAYAHAGWTTVLVGSADQHADAVAELGIGPVTVVAD